MSDTEKPSWEWRNEVARLREQLDQMTAKRDAAEMRSVAHLKMYTEASQQLAFARRDTLLDAANEVQRSYLAQTHTSPNMTEIVEAFVEFLREEATVTQEREGRP